MNLERTILLAVCSQLLLFVASGQTNSPRSGEIAKAVATPSTTANSAPKSSSGIHVLEGDFKQVEGAFIEQQFSYSGAATMAIGQGVRFQVVSSASVSLHAAKEIRFGPGFSVAKGAIFSATVDPPPPGKTSGASTDSPASGDNANKGDQGGSNATGNSSSPTSPGQMTAMPSRTELGRNYPNPFNPSTSISYALAHDAHVTLKVYNALGQIVATLLDENQTAGFRSVRFDASQLSSGVYFYRFEAGQTMSIRKMILLK